MLAEKTYNENILQGIWSKVVDYCLLIKLRLSLLVVFSAVMGFLMAGVEFNSTKLILLILGGALITAASNAINQILEKDYDKLMDRTANRPLPTGRMSGTEAVLVAGITGSAGITILWFYLNPLSGLLGTLALLSYGFIYTSLKRISPIAVFVGAFPGALPPLIGWVAATGSINFYGFILFAIQFVWQFPHFWAIAWVMDDQYRKAGFKLLPSEGGRNKSSAFQTIVYTLMLLPIGLMPLFYQMAGMYSAIVITLCGVVFLFQAIKLYRECTIKSAVQLMFGSFFYLPLVQLALVLDKI